MEVPEWVCARWGGGSEAWVVERKEVGVGGGAERE